MSRKTLRLIMLGLAAVASITFAVWLIVLALAPLPSAPPVEAQQEKQQETPPAPPPEPPALAARRAIESRIAATPEVARFFDRLRLALPSEYESALVALENRQIADNPDLWLSEAVKSLRQSRGTFGAKADAGALSNVFAKQLAVLDALSARDPKLCVDFLYGGASEAIFAFAAENRALVSDLAIAGLDAIVDGEQKKIARGAPTEADFQTLEKALTEKGLGKAEIEALLDGRTPDPPLPDAQMCAAGRTYLQTLATLPEETRLRIYALAIELMARS